MTHTVTTPVVLMLVAHETLVSQELDHLEATRARLDGVTSFPSRSIELENRIDELRRLPLKSVVERRFELVRLGSLLARGARVVGFWTDGTLTLEPGAPTPDPLTLEEMIAAEAPEHVAVVTAGGVSRHVSAPNPAFAAS